MRTNRFHHVLAMASMMGSTLAAEPPALRDLLSDPSYRQVQISPDGNFLGLILPQAEKDVLVVVDRQSNKIASTLVFSGSRESVSEFTWVKNSQLILKPAEILSWNEQPSWFGELFAAKADGSNFRAIYGYRAGEQTVGSHVKKAESTRGSGFLLSDLPDDPDNVLLTSVPWTAVGDGGRSEVLSVNLKNARTKRLMGSPVLEGQFLAAANGDVRLVAGTDREGYGLVFKRVPGVDEWQQIARNSLTDTGFAPLALSADGNTAYYLANQNAPTTGLFSYDVASGKSELMHRHPDLNVKDIYVDPVSRKPLWAVHAEDLSVHYLVQDNPWVQVHKRIAKSFPDSRFKFTSHTKDYKKLIVEVYSDRDPGVWYSVDMETNKAKEELIANLKIDPELMLPMQRISLNARDGLKLNGFFTAPKPVEGTKPPLVVLVHGGPHAQDEWGFNPEVQVLATRGYAVLQVNFRGSEGYGDQFEAAGHGEWGRKMQDDVTDATKWALAQGLADPQRVCIMGGSYGGYASMMGLIREPDLYRCGIDMFGVTDLEVWFSDGDVPDKRWGEAYLRSTLGNDPKEWAARSPARLADKVKAPVLIIAGEEDERVPFIQSELMEDALKKAGKPVETLYFDKEAHGLFNPENRVKAYEKVLAFLDKHIGVQASKP